MFLLVLSISCVIVYSFTGCCWKLLSQAGNQQRKRQEKKPKRSNKNICQQNNACRVIVRWIIDEGLLFTCTSHKASQSPTRAAAMLQKCISTIQLWLQRGRASDRRAISRLIGGSSERPTRVKLALPVPRGRFQLLWHPGFVPSSGTGEAGVAFRNAGAWRKRKLEVRGSRLQRNKMQSDALTRWQNSYTAYRRLSSRLPVQYLCLFMFMRQVVSF